MTTRPSQRVVPPTVKGHYAAPWLSWRRHLRGLILLILVTLAGPQRADAYDMTRRDRMAVLYSNQVVFDRKGEPLVSVRITEAQDEITIESTHQLTLLPGGDDASRVRTRGRSTWTVKIEDSRPGKVRFWVVAERISASDLGHAAARRDHWRDAGHEVKLFEAGALIGLAGQTLDTRTLTVCLDPQPTHAAALARAKSIATTTPLLGGVLDEPIDRPSGWLVAREKRSGIEIRSRDLLWFTPASGKTITIPGLEWGHGTPKRGRADRRYHGDVYLTVGNDGHLTVVNLLSAERLLEGVVPAELFPSAPPAALQAQAVAARGQLLAKVGTRHRSDPYLLCAETHCQVYSGDSARRKSTNAAVKATRGKLLFKGEELVDTTYSSTCGGHTEAFHEMWGGAPKSYSMGLVDTAAAPTAPIAPDAVAHFIDHPPKAHCAPSGTRSKVYRWTKTLSGSKVSRALNKRGTVGQVHTIRATRRGVSGRALAVEYVGTKGRHLVKGSYNNRKLLGNLRSGMWVVERRGGKPDSAPAAWHFRGGGFGHGVGMCQHGAMGMARQGDRVEAILSHYYPGSTLKRAW